MRNLTHTKSKSVILSILHIPLFILAAVLLALSSVGSYKVAQSIGDDTGFILGNDDDGDDDNSGKGNSNDDDNDEDEDDNDEDEDDNDEDEDDNDEDDDDNDEDEADNDEDDGDDNKFKFKIDDGKVEYESEYIDENGNVVKEKYKLEDDGRIRYEYKYGGQKFKLDTKGTLPTKTPQEIVDSAELEDDDLLEEVSFELDEDRNEFEYKLKIQKREKLFGLINVSLDSVLQFDPDTGELIGVDQTFLTKLLDLISF